MAYFYQVVSSHLCSGQPLVNRNAKRLPSQSIANHNELNRSSIMAIVNYEGHELDLTGYELDFFNALCDGDHNLSRFVLAKSPSMDIHEYVKVRNKTLSNISIILDIVNSRDLGFDYVDK